MKIAVLYAGAIAMGFLGSKIFPHEPLWASLVISFLGTTVW